MFRPYREYPITAPNKPSTTTPEITAGTRMLEAGDEVSADCVLVAFAEVSVAFDLLDSSVLLFSEVVLDFPVAGFATTLGVTGFGTVVGCLPVVGFWVGVNEVGSLEVVVF